MHEKLTQSPLTYMLAQIKFSEILSMENHIKALQETIRGEFSEFRKQEIKAIDFVRVEAKTATIWHFLDKTFTTGVSVATDSITIHTSKYLSFENMIDKINDVLTKFNAILKINLYLRIGLRYVNLIHDGIHQHLQPALLGYPLKNDNIFENSYLARSETLQKTTSGMIKVNSMHMSDKSIMNSGNFYISPDLGQGANLLSFDHHKSKTPKKEYVMLDIDHFTDTAGDFTARKIVSQLEKLHEGVFVAFHNAITTDTWKKWK